MLGRRACAMRCKICLKVGPRAFQGSDSARTSKCDIVDQEHHFWYPVRLSKYATKGSAASHSEEIICIASYIWCQRVKCDEIASTSTPLVTPLKYSWIGRPLRADKKLIYQQTRWVTTLLRPPLESSRRREFKSAGSIFAKSFLSSFFKITSKILPKQK